MGPAALEGALFELFSKAFGSLVTRLPYRPTHATIDDLWRRVIHRERRGSQPKIHQNFPKAIKYRKCFFKRQRCPGVVIDLRGRSNASVSVTPCILFPLPIVFVNNDSTSLLISNYFV